MTDAAAASGMWRISVRGTLHPSTALLLSDLHVVVVDNMTVLETGPMRPDSCASTIAEFQSLGLDVVSLHWLPVGPDPPVSE